MTRPDTNPNNSQVAQINKFLQTQLQAKGYKSITAVEAARWLDNTGLLTDSPSRPGRPLRELMRAKRITGQRQTPERPNGRWFVDKVK